MIIQPVIASLWGGSAFSRAVARLLTHRHADTFDGMVLETFLILVGFGVLVSVVAWIVTAGVPAGKRDVIRFLVLTGILLFFAPFADMAVPRPVQPRMEDLATRLGGRYGILAVVGIWFASLVSTLVNVVRGMKERNAEPTSAGDVATRAAPEK